MSVSSKARFRIDSLLDANSFVEIGARVRARSTEFNLSGKSDESDGVITGYGVIDGRLVYVYSQDPEVLSGSIGEMHARKIIKLYDMALRMGAPVIGIFDSSGIRLQETSDSVAALSEIYVKASKASGVIPQISAVYGNCGGGLAVLAALTDFCFMEKGGGRLFVNPADAVRGNYRDRLDTSRSDFRAQNTMDVCGAFDESELPLKIRELISYLPSNNEDDDAYEECTDDLNRASSTDIESIADSSKVFEIRKDFAKEISTGFIRLNGTSIGFIVNKSKLLTANAARKAADMVRFCDAFGIPVLSMVDIKGYANSMEDEVGLASEAAALVYAYSAAQVPKVSVIAENAYGSCAAVLNAVSSAADIKIAFDRSNIGAMNAGDAARILGEGKSKEEIKEIENTYDSLLNGASSAAARGHVDEIIEPSDIRKYLIGAFEMLYSKRCEL